MDRRRAGWRRRGGRLSRTAFLTGATGFIGSRLARTLHEQGWALRCLVRRPERATALESLGAELVAGDIDDIAALARGLDGATLACHLAALYDIGVVDADAMERINVGGTRAFLEAIARAGTPRALYVSTTAALGPVAAGEGNETSSYDGPYPTAYHRTKTAAHRLALGAQAGGAPLVIVAPANVYGPGDHGPNARFLGDLLAGRVPALLSPPAWLSFAHVDDVVAGVAAAAERGETRGVYVLSGEHESVNAFADRAMRLAGKRAPRLRVPVPLAAATGALLDLVARPTGLRLPISRESVAIGGRGRWLHSHARATRELGYAPRSIDDGLPGTVSELVARRARGGSAT
jgi:dihydroflavonol-4-reductase